MSNSSISTFGSNSTSRKESLTPIDVSLPFTNLRRRSLGYEHLNGPPKANDEKIESFPPRLEKVDSSTEFMSSFKVSIEFIFYKKDIYGKLITSQDCEYHIGNIYLIWYSKGPQY